MTERELELLNYIKQRGECSRAEAAEHMKVNVRTVQTHFTSLCRQGHAHSTGVGSLSRWRAGAEHQYPAPVEVAIAQVSSVWEYAARMS
jgi:predicted ArsR family transcriptional regulator